MNSNGLIGNKQKALIHVAKAELKLNEVSYRALLSSVGVASSRELTWWQYHQLLGHFKALGFKFKARKPAWKKNPPKNKEALLKKIGALLADMNLPDAYADGIAKRVAKVDKVIFADFKGLRAIVAALVYRQKRVNRNQEKKHAKQA